jgi:hypothetical protein
MPRHVDHYDCCQLLATCRQNPAQRFGLSNRARKAVIERTFELSAARLRLSKLVKSLFDERDGQVIRYQFPAIVNGLNLMA